MVKRSLPQTHRGGNIDPAIHGEIAHGGVANTFASWSESLGDHLLWLALKTADQTWQFFSPHCTSNFGAWQRCQSILEVFSNDDFTCLADQQARWLFILDDAICVVLWNAVVPLIVVGLDRQTDPAICSDLFGVPVEALCPAEVDCSSHRQEIR